MATKRGLNRLGLGPVESEFARCLRGCAQPERGEVFGDSGCHVSRRRVGVDVREEVATCVPGQHGSRVAVVGQHAFRYDVGVAVVSSASAAESVKDCREREYEEDDESDCIRMKSFQQFGLLDGARKTVEQYRGGCSVASEAFGDDLGDVAVGNKPTGFE